MKKELIETINRVININKVFGKNKKDFDKTDVIETFVHSKKRLKKNLIHLAQCDLNNKTQLIELLLYTKLEYDNLLWCFDEIIELIKDTLI